MLTYRAIFHSFSRVVEMYIKLCSTHFCNLLRPCCVSDWKPVSVFGMKHLWDVHFLLLILLYLLGAVTSQVNPGLCSQTTIFLCYDLDSGGM